MTTHLILIHPAANRVYRESAAALMRSELLVLDAAVLGGRIHEVSPRTVGGVGYLACESDGLDDDALARLSDLSSLYALFASEGDLLRPVAVAPADRYSSDLVSIQRYVGKTNETFTKLLLNVTAAATDRPEALRAGAMSVLDPVCGRGTTLNQAMMYGLDASGVDVDGKDFEAYSTFIRTWLKDKRIKHRADETPLRRHGAKLGRRLDVTFAATKEQYRRGETQHVAYAHTDTRRLAEVFKAASFDVVVGDAPYGVQHGSHDSGLSRRPEALLDEAVPAWTAVLRPGGAMGLSWNTKVLGRDAMEAVLERSGLEVCRSAGFDGFAHRVDQSIERDLVVAKKPPRAGAV